MSFTKVFIEVSVFVVALTLNVLYIGHIERHKYKFKLNIYLFHVVPVDQLSTETDLPTSEENTSHDVRAQFLFYCTFTCV